MRQKNVSVGHIESHSVWFCELNAFPQDSNGFLLPPERKQERRLVAAAVKVVLGVFVSDARENFLSLIQDLNGRFQVTSLRGHSSLRGQCVPKQPVLGRSGVLLDQFISRLRTLIDRRVDSFEQLILKKRFVASRSGRNLRAELIQSGGRPRFLRWLRLFRRLCAAVRRGAQTAGNQSAQNGECSCHFDSATAKKRQRV